MYHIRYIGKYLNKFIFRSDYMIKGLDNGYMYTKDNELRIMKSAFTTEDKVVSGAIPIIIDGKQYYVGIGKGTFQLDKTNLALSTGRKSYLVVGLSISQYKEQKDKLKETILSYNNSYIECQNKIKQFIINDVLVFPQGIASLYAIGYYNIGVKHFS